MLPLYFLKAFFSLVALSLFIIYENNDKKMILKRLSTLVKHINNAWWSHITGYAQKDLFIFGSVNQHSQWWSLRNPDADPLPVSTALYISDTEAELHLLVQPICSDWKTQKKPKKRTEKL